MLERCYLSDAPSEIPRKDNVRYLKNVDELLTIESSLIYCDSEEVAKILKKYDKQGLLHFGCRGLTPAMMYQAPVLRFGTNYIICSPIWEQKKYKEFLKFKPASPVELPETHYININSVSDDEATDIFLKQMATLSKTSE